VTAYRLVSEAQVDIDIEAAFRWYENQQTGLGLEFLDELRAAYDRIVDGPFRYSQLRSNTRRALLKRFPYAIYFVVEEQTIVVLAVLHTSRDPAEWQRRSR
jgi:plasmid stabilization system protein ParE